MNGPLDKAAIAALIPHTGPMCLLDSVVTWDSGSIVCRASSHHAPDNPMAVDGYLDAICGVEYAAQAMAVHGGLIGDGHRPTAGYLASLRDVVCTVERLDMLQGDLVVTAALLVAEIGRGIYRFSLTCDGGAVLSGRAAVVIAAGQQAR